MLNSFAVASCISETLAPTPKEPPKSSFSKIAIRDDGRDEIVFGIVSVMEIIAAAATEFAERDDRGSIVTLCGYLLPDLTLTTRFSACSAVAFVFPVTYNDTTMKRG